MGAKEDGAALAGMSLSERVRGLERVAQACGPKARAPRIGEVGTGLRTAIAAAFPVIVNLRQRGFTWPEVLQLLLDAGVAPDGSNVKQVRSEFAFQSRRRRQGANEHAPHDAGERQEPVARAARRGGSGARVPKMVGVGGGTGPRAGAAGDAASVTAREAAVEMVRLPDGREFPLGTELVPIMPPEKWTVKVRKAYYNGNADGKPPGVPMVPIKDLLNPPVNSGGGS